MSSQIFRDDLLQDRVCLVTGGGTGIGAAIARELGHLGATVVIASRKASNIEPAAAGLSEEVGRTVHGAVLDIRDRERVAEVVAEVLEQHGRIDVLVNNGGGQFMAPAETISPRGWDAVINTNLTGTWNLTQAVANACMLEHGGRIVNISMLTRRTFPGMAHSHASRAGVEALTRTLAIEWARAGIRINCVAPGLIASSGLKRYPVPLSFFTEMIKLVPLKRMGTSEEVAWLVAYLAGPAGDYVTGQTYTIDGGRELYGDHWTIPDPPDLGPPDVPTEPWEEE